MIGCSQRHLLSGIWRVLFKTWCVLFCLLVWPRLAGLLCPRSSLRIFPPCLFISRWLRFPWKEIEREKQKKRRPQLDSLAQAGNQIRRIRTAASSARSCSWSSSLAKPRSRRRQRGWSCRVSILRVVIPDRTFHISIASNFLGHLILRS